MAQSLQMFGSEAFGLLRHEAELAQRERWST